LSFGRRGIDVARGVGSSITLDHYGHLMPGSEAQEEAAWAAGSRLTGERTGEQLANENAEPLA
jgi:hypothetical protein